MRALIQMPTIPGMVSYFCMKQCSKGGLIYSIKFKTKHQYLPSHTKNKVNDQVHCQKILWMAYVMPKAIGFSSLLFCPPPTP